jgi:hypothetical protein
MLLRGCISKPRDSSPGAVWWLACMHACCLRWPLAAATHCVAASGVIELLAAVEVAADAGSGGCVLVSQRPPVGCALGWPRCSAISMSGRHPQRSGALDRLVVRLCDYSLGTLALIRQAVGESTALGMIGTADKGVAFLAWLQGCQKLPKNQPVAGQAVPGRWPGPQWLALKPSSPRCCGTTAAVPVVPVPL